MLIREHTERAGYQPRRTVQFGAGQIQKRSGGHADPPAAYGWSTTLIQPSSLFRKISYPCGACSSGR
jgi:hypothetical protein